MRVQRLVQAIVLDMGVCTKVVHLYDNGQWYTFNLIGSLRKFYPLYITEHVCDCLDKKSLLNLICPINFRPTLAERI